MNAGKPPNLVVEVAQSFISECVTVTCGNTVVYVTGDKVSLPGDYNSEIRRDTLPELLACLRYVEAMPWRG